MINGQRLHRTASKFEPPHASVVIIPVELSGRVGGGSMGGACKSQMEHADMHIASIVLPGPGG